MILLDNGDIKSESSSDEEMPPLEDWNDVDVVEPVNGDLLVTKCALNMQPKIGGNEEQRDHIFHTRYHIKDKVLVFCILGIFLRNYNNFI